MAWEIDNLDPFLAQGVDCKIDVAGVIVEDKHIQVLFGIAFDCLFDHVRTLRCIACEDTHVHVLARVLLKVSDHDWSLGEKILLGVLVIDLKI